MKRRGRIRVGGWVAKWAGLVACVMIAGVIAANYRWYCSYIWKRSDGDLTDARGRWGLMGVDGGNLQFAPNDPMLRRFPSGWTLGRHPSGFQRFQHWLPMWMAGTVFVLPLWIPLVLIALPTALLFWRDRSRPGHCPCGYSLTGLAPGAPCPECGKETA